MNITPSERIYVAKSAIPNAGRGVFAAATIKKREIIEVCPVIVMPPKDYTHLEQTLILHYQFAWGKGRETVAICLGYGSLYNHSYTPNAMYRKHFDHAYIEFIALEDIAKDEEIIVNYHGDPTDTSPLWMNDVPEYQAMDNPE